MPLHLNQHHPQGPRLCTARLRQRGALLMEIAGLSDRAVSLTLVDDPTMAGLNRRYRGRDGPTNVLSFPGGPLPGPEGEREIAEMGDVIISTDTAAREAARLGRSLHRHLEVLLVHGLAHLMGFDHERSAEEAQAMSALERSLLAKLDTRRQTMPRLAVNVDHVATVRQARGINEPDPVIAAGICELAGAAGIVVHLREDRRHIQDRDVRLLRKTVKTRLNLEMAASKEIIAIALEVVPDMVTLVPEKRQELTTEGGLDVRSREKKIGRVISRMHKAGIPVSLFVDPVAKQIEAARRVEADYVELHTGRYCDARDQEEQEAEFRLIEECAEMAFELGLEVNAGHGLDYRTTARVAAIPYVSELSIGHAIITRAVYVGLDKAVREMLAIVEGAVQA